MTGDHVVIVGAGLVGTVLSMFLARSGHDVHVYDNSIPAPATGDGRRGSSVNITLCRRGLEALDALSLGERARAASVSTFGRAVHLREGRTTYQPYGNHGETVYCVGRAALHQLLLEAARERFGVAPRFGEECIAVDPAGAAVFRSTLRGTTSRAAAATVFGADGARSRVRSCLEMSGWLTATHQYLGHSYKELLVPAGAAQDCIGHGRAIHFWPREDHLLVGFPNVDGSMTLSLHLPNHGLLSFDTVRTADDFLQLVKSSFPDLLPVGTLLEAEFVAHRPRSMVTVRTWPWVAGDRVALIGDAAHAIVPYLGQGANAGFEDCLVLDGLVTGGAGSRSAVLHAFQVARKPGADAIAQVAVDHLKELASAIGDDRFHLRTAVERKLNRMFPDIYFSLYSLISFTSTPYEQAVELETKRRDLVEAVVEAASGEEDLESEEIEQLIASLAALGPSHDGAGPPAGAALKLPQAAGE